MYLLIVLAVELLLIYRFSKEIRTNSKLIYLISASLSVLGALYAFSEFGQSIPESIRFLRYFYERLFINGLLPSSLFIIVMATAAFNKKWDLTRKLYSVRAELSIIASIFIFSHILIYSIKFGVVFWEFALDNSWKLLFSRMLIPLLLYLDAIVCFIIVFPLFITSFPRVRKKMNAKSWKKLQKWSYLLYFLIYLHAFLLNGPFLRRYIDLAVYTLIFAAYLYGRIINERARKIKLIPRD
jgi:sulfoxide reductase heme-binding subunit YedZ